MKNRRPQSHLVLIEITTLPSRLPGELAKDPNTLERSDYDPQLLICARQLVLALFLLPRGVHGITHPPRLRQMLTRPQLLTGQSKLAFNASPVGRHRPAPFLLHETPSFTPDRPKLKSYNVLVPFTSIHPLRQLETLVEKVPFVPSLLPRLAFTLEWTQCKAIVTEQDLDSP